MKSCPKSFPFVCVSAGAPGGRSDRVFPDAYWGTDLDGALGVFRERDEVARFSAGSGWLVYACDEHGTPMSPSPGSGIDVPERDAGGGDPEPHAESAPSPAPAGPTVQSVAFVCGGCGTVHRLDDAPESCPAYRSGTPLAPDTLIEVRAVAGPCRKCGGCGRIANDEDGSPWSDWEALPPGADAAVRMGIVVPVTCPACAGTGKGA